MISVKETLRFSSWEGTLDLPKAPGVVIQMQAIGRSRYCCLLGQTAKRGQKWYFFFSSGSSVFVYKEFHRSLIVRTFENAAVGTTVFNGQVRIAAMTFQCS